MKYLLSALLGPIIFMSTIGPFVVYPLFLFFWFRWRAKVPVGSPLYFGLLVVAVGFPVLLGVVWLLVSGAQPKIHSSTSALLFFGVPGWATVGTLWIASTFWATAMIFQIRAGKRLITGRGRRVEYGAAILLLLVTLLWGARFAYDEYWATRASSEYTDSNALRDLFHNRFASRSRYVLGDLAANPNSPPDLLLEISALKDPELNVINQSFRNLVLHGNFNLSVMRLVARNPNTPLEVLENFSSSSDDLLRVDVASNPKTPLSVLRKLNEDPHKLVKSALARNPNTTSDMLDALAKDSRKDTSKYTKLFIIKNDNTSEKTLELLSGDPDLRVSKRAREKLKTRKTKPAHGRKGSGAEVLQGAWKGLSQETRQQWKAGYEAS